MNLIFEEYKNPQDTFFYPLVYKENTYEKTAISIFALLVLGVSCLFLFNQQSYKKTVVQYYANDQNLPNRITYSEYSDKREANYGGTLNITSIKQANDGVYATYEGQLTPLQY